MSHSRTRPASLLGLALGASASLACGVEPAPPSPIARPSPYDARTTGVRSAHLQGQVGPVWLDADADRLQAYSSMHTLRVAGVALLETRAVMLQLTLRTDEVELVPGVQERFGADDLGRLVLLGCVGQDVDVYDEYDRPADEVELVVEREDDGAPGDVEVALTGQWLHEELEAPTTASFTFVLVR